MQSYVLYRATYIPAWYKAINITAVTTQRDKWEASGVQSDN
jgi:hypothetical protein